MKAGLRYRIIVCRGPECGDKRESATLVSELERLLAERGLGAQVEIDRQSCFGRCLSGPNIMVRDVSTVTGGGSTFGVLLPGATGDAVLYNAVQPRELARILEEHIIGGRPIRAMLNRKPRGA